MSIQSDRDKLKKPVEEYGLAEVIAQSREICLGKADFYKGEPKMRLWRQDAGTLTRLEVNDRR